MSHATKCFLVSFGLALGGCSTTHQPDAVTTPDIPETERLSVTETRPCRTPSAAGDHRFLIVSTAEYATECVVLDLGSASNMLSGISMAVVDRPCADVFYDGRGSFGPASTDTVGSARARVETEVRADGLYVSYEVELTLMGSLGERTTTIEGEYREVPEGACRAPMP